jgi:cyanate lyase
MRPYLAAVAAILLASSALSAQPAQRVSERLALNDDEECTAVSAPC